VMNDLDDSSSSGHVSSWGDVVDGRYTPNCHCNIELILLKSPALLPIVIAIPMMVNSYVVTYYV
jgi:hypothetical protein